MENPFDVLDDVTTQLDITFEKKFRFKMENLFNTNRFRMDRYDIIQSRIIANNGKNFTKRRVALYLDIIKEYEYKVSNAYFSCLALAC